MLSFSVTILPSETNITNFSLGFALPAQSDRLVADAITALGSLNLPGGHGAHFYGPAPIPVAIALAHAVAHLYSYVAWFDPKLGKFVVAISHNPAFTPGQLLP
jgi:CRISPR-associated protein Csx3